MSEAAEKVGWDEKVFTVESAIEAIESLCSWQMLGSPRSYMEVPFNRISSGELEIMRVIYRTYQHAADNASDALREVVRAVCEELVKANEAYTGGFDDQIIIFWRLPGKINLTPDSDGKCRAYTRLDWTPKSSEQLKQEEEF